ncbi:hypothetical protein BDZ45DRAFT_248834 [Acephala macrosclerotiorum]|nr:hypothetical protein BDZ45DRAFT_248834 [Acephala macrosclerotiorum]
MTWQCMKNDFFDGTKVHPSNVCVHSPAIPALSQITASPAVYCVDLGLDSRKLATKTTNGRSRLSIEMMVIGKQDTSTHNQPKRGQHLRTEVRSQKKQHSHIIRAMTKQIILQPPRRIMPSVVVFKLPRRRHRHLSPHESITISNISQPPTSLQPPSTLKLNGPLSPC